MVWQNSWQGTKDKVDVYIDENVYKTIPKIESLRKKKYIKAIVNYQGPILAPIKKGDILGELKVFYKDEVIETYDLLAYENIKKVNILSRLIRSINYLVWGDV